VYKKALHEILEKNGPFISEYTTTNIGSIEVEDISMKDAVLSVFPQSGSFEDFETFLKFVEGKGAELTFSEFQFDLVGQFGGKTGLLTGKIEEIFIKLNVVKTEKEKESSTDLPEFDIENFEVKFEEDTIKWKIDGEEKTGEALHKATLAWLKNAIKAQMIVAKFVINTAQSKIEDYLTNSINLDDYKGNLSFSEIKFFEDYIEMSLITSLTVEDEDGYKMRVNEALAENAGENENAIEVVFDENIINTGLYAAFHSDGEFGLRKVLRLDEPDNEYASMFEAVLKTQVVGQAWKEIQNEFGENKR
jgi:HSP20 family molecular chaperone IbpA